MPPFLCESERRSRKVDVRLPGKGNSNSHGARPVHLIIKMIQWKNSLSDVERRGLRCPLAGLGAELLRTLLDAAIPL